MDGTDPLDPGHRCRVAQHHAIAAVHLQVDQTGGEDAARQHHPCARQRAAGRDQGDHLPDLDQQRRTPVQHPAVKHIRPDEMLQAHNVCVTLRRCGGVSGLQPRRRASASMQL